MIGSAARRLTQTRDGGFAFAGDVASLIKTDSIGNILWNKTFGPARVSYTVVQTSDGGYAIAGEYYITSSNRDFWLVKTDVDGNKQWEKMYGGAGTEWASSMVQTSDGGYAMAGITNSFGANFDGWLVKTNSTGNIEWSRTYGGALSDDFRSVVQTKDGGYVMAGETEISVGLSQIWLVKTDSNGNMQWNYSYDQGMALEVIQTADGGYAMPGALGSVNLVKTDANGIVQWKRRYSEFDGAYSIVGTSDGGYALAGYKYHSGNSAFSFVKTDVSGNIQWSQTYDSPEQDFASSMVQTSDGGFAIIGEAGSSIWLVKTDVEYGLAWTDSTVDTVTLYRGATDPYWNFVRVRIWEPKTP